MFAGKQREATGVLHAASDRAFAVLRALIDQGQAEGALEPGEPERVGLVLFATIQGIAALVTAGVVDPEQAPPSSTTRPPRSCAARARRPDVEAAARGLRLGFALLAATAIVVNIAHAVEDDVFRPANFFSYFTNLSNLFAIAVLLILAIRAPTSRRFELVRGAATFCMAVTGIVYAVLLADIGVGVTDPWINTVIHRVMPLVTVLDWWLGPRAPVDPRRALVWLTIPLVYFAYSLVRGPLADDWYPYPFMNPTRDGGYPRVLLVAVVLAVCMALLAAALARLGRQHRRTAIGG